MRQRLLLSSALWLTAIGAAACANTVPTQESPCPCAAGYVCCSNNNECAKDQASCGGGTSTSRSELEQAKGVWKGYVENYRFPSGLDTISLTVEIGANGQPVGKIVLGKQDAPPAPTDPNKAWPADAEWNDPYKVPSFVEGYSYGARGVSWEDHRLRFKLASHEAWQTWCGIQTPVMWPQQSPMDTPYYSCTPDVGFTTMMNQCQIGDSTVPGTPIECGKFALCFLTGVCQCTATTCAATINDDISVDIALRTGVGDGSISLNGQNYNVRVTQSHPTD